MKISPYIGHPSQLCSVEQVRLEGGRGDGMRLIQVRNESGLEFTVSADRCADISRLIYKGINLSYFSPCGYVSPSYYDGVGDGFLKSFTAGFFTTCGLTAVGSPCIDHSEVLPLHGSISNTPCENIYFEENDDEIRIHAKISDSVIFKRKLILERVLSCGKRENYIKIRDTVTNNGSSVSPLMILYHINIGYPLLSENTILEIPSISVSPRDDHAKEDIDKWNKMIKPTPGFQEQCYYHKFKKDGIAKAYNPDIHTGVEISFDSADLDTLTQWKMMGVHDYVLGLEPGNCTPDGRDILRKENRLKFINPGEEKTFQVMIKIIER